MESRNKESNDQRFDKRKFSLCKYQVEYVSSYVDAFLTDEIDELVKKLLEKLYIFQRRLFKTNPLKLSVHRRYVIGIKQAKKCIEAEKCQLVLVAPDVDENLAVSITELKNKCRLKKVPFAFSLSKAEFPLLLHLPGSHISVVAITNEEGARDLFKEVLLATSTEFYE